MSTRLRLRVRVRGVVQGVGFRPFIYTTAATLGLAGCVRNDGSGAIIEVEGHRAAIDDFLAQLTDRPPPLAVIESIVAQPIPLVGGTGFTIAETSLGSAGRTLVSPDVAMCADCDAELRDPANRRYRHPFITCTNCGPRFTIITSMPYDRAGTTMATFRMCPDCAREYGNPADRRFHAQTICCPCCGPTLRYQAAAGNVAFRDSALRAARDLVRDGGLLAVKGIGGYHLACDAGNEAAVAELRRRKRRGDKPFAVMMPDLSTARRIVAVDAVAQRVLTGPQRPVALLPRLPGCGVAASVAPRNPDLGVILAYTPLHALLFGLPEDDDGPDVMVMTSGNLGGEPICYEDADALKRLSGLADGWLTHNRPIAVPCDDSVVRVLDEAEMPIRRSRGYAPMPVQLPVALPASLAVGADLKNTMAVAQGRYAWLSQHIGDMDDLATLSAFDVSQQHLRGLTGVEPGLLIADAHPRYRSTAWAQHRAGKAQVRTVQHHHAHIASVMTEHGCDESEQVIGFAFDGTGYGPDGAVWGGEVLRADYHRYRRLARLKYVPLAGGDISVLRPYRMALAHLWAAGIDWDPDLPPVAACAEAERSALAHQLATGLGCTATSSMGRLFDAVSALSGVCQEVDYEAQAAIELEGLARGIDTEVTGYAFGICSRETPVLIDPAPVLLGIVADHRSNTPAALIGARFHRALADLVVRLAVLVNPGASPRRIALSGGVFQNALLLCLCLEALRGRGFEVMTHRRVPPNDGGIALGQLLVGSCHSGEEDADVLGGTRQDSQPGGP